MKCIRCKKDIEQVKQVTLNGQSRPHKAQLYEIADYIIADDLVTDEIFEVLVATVTNAKGNTREIAIRCAQDAAGLVGNVTKVEPREVTEKVQKTGIVCPDCYKPTDTVIWGIHKI